MKYFYLLLISMLPVIELRGAVPLGIAWGLNPVLVYVVSILGNLLLVPFLIKYAKVVLVWCEKIPKIGFLFTKILNIGRHKAKRIIGAQQIGLFLFVAIPLPGTGAWTGSLIAAVLDLPIKKAYWPIAIGVITAGIIMMLGTFGIIAIS